MYMDFYRVTVICKFVRYSFLILTKFNNEPGCVHVMSIVSYCCYFSISNE